MSPSPTEKLSQLSIESMPPTTRQQSRSQKSQSSTESEANSVDSRQVDNCLRFPSKLTYSLENLNPDIRQHVTDAVEGLPQITLQECAEREGHVIFQVSELANFRIRTGSRSSQWSTPSCSCGDESPSRTPCRHVLWLFDQITAQLLDNSGEVLTLNKYGYANVLENPYEMITECHLDILADDLHSRVLRTASDTEDALYNARRVQEVREILASLNRTPIDEYRPDIFDHPTGGRRVVKRNDLECTIFRMLCQNNEFFQYFLSSMKSDELVNNTFRKLQKRADAALAGLDAYAESPSSRQPSDNPKDVTWCATHLQAVVKKVHTAIMRARRPLELWERQAAGRTLLHILRQVVDRCRDLTPPTLENVDRNLYLKLIGDRDRNFAIGALNSLAPDAIHPFTAELDRIIFDMQKHGVPHSYAEKLRDVYERARRVRMGGSPIGSKRHRARQGGRGGKRTR
jgi:hypothetical protein